MKVSPGETNDLKLEKNNHFGLNTVTSGSLVSQMTELNGQALDSDFDRHDFVYHLTVVKLQLKTLK